MDEYSESTMEGDEEGRLFLDIRKHSKTQNVIVVRTGKEPELSALIDFEELRASGECLPLCRPDVTEPGVSAVRVALPVAVNFIADLERREDAAFPLLRIGPELGKYSCRAIEDTERLLKSAEEKGFNNEVQIRFAILDIMAGNDPNKWEHIPVHNMLWR